MNSFYHITAKIAKEKYLKFKARLEKSISSGNFDSFSTKKKNKWVSRVEKYRLKLEHLNLKKGTLVAGSVLTATAVAAQQVPNYEKGSTLLLSTPTNNVAIANLDDDPDFEILFSTDAGSFVVEKDGSRTNPTALSNVTGDFVLGDLDGDGVDDVLYERNYILYRSFNDGYGAFSSPGCIGYIGTAPNKDIEIVDFDSDGDNDIVWAQGNNSIYFKESTGGGEFEDAITLYAAPYQLHEIEIADLDEDGDMDIVTKETEQYYYGSPYYTFFDRDVVKSIVNTTDGVGVPTLGTTNTIYTAFRYGQIGELALADLDGDENIDAVFDSSEFGKYYLNTANGNHPSQNSIGFSNDENYYLNYSGVSDFKVTDFDQDGDLDVLVSGDSYVPYLLVNTGSSFNSFYLNLGGGYGEFSYSDISLAIGDLDDDG